MFIDYFLYIKVPDFFMLCVYLITTLHFPYMGLSTNQFSYASTPAEVIHVCTQIRLTETEISITGNYLKLLKIGFATLTVLYVFISMVPVLIELHNK